MFVADLLHHVPRRLIWHVASRYIAGSSLENAVRVVRQLNQQGFTVALSYLGEHAESPTDCNRAVRMYERVLEAIHQRRFHASLSVKPSQLGLELNRIAFLLRAEQLLDMAERFDTFVRWDMEGSQWTSATLDAYCQLRQQFPTTGVALQAMLRRSQRDAERLAHIRANVRICKGAYREPPDRAFQRRGEIRASFIRILDTLLSAGRFVEIATHDDILIDSALSLIKAYRVPDGRYRFAVLLGVQPERARQLVDDGHEVLVYVPFGEQWLEYSIRRFNENPQLFWDVSKALVLPGR